MAEENSCNKGKFFWQRKFYQQQKILIEGENSCSRRKFSQQEKKEKQ